MSPRLTRGRQRPLQIVPVSFQPPDPRLLDIEVKPAQVEGGEASPRFFGTPERLDFHLFIAVRSGQLRHWVDFDEVHGGAGSLVSIRPGQVHQFDLQCHWRGWVAIFRPEGVRGPRGPDELAAAKVLDALPPHLRLDSSEQQAVEELLSRMAVDAQSPGTVSGLNPLLRSQLHVLLLRLKLAHARAEPGLPRNVEMDRQFRRFAAAVEAHFPKIHDVARYARMLGCAERTLTRASLLGSGVAAKEFIARRVLLEAKRMLVHTHMPAADIALAIGFDEPTHFGKLFRRKEGCTPGEFRAGYRSLPSRPR